MLLNASKLVALHQAGMTVIFQVAAVARPRIQLEKHEGVLILIQFSTLWGA